VHGLIDIFSNQPSASFSVFHFELRILHSFFPANAFIALPQHFAPPGLDDREGGAYYKHSAPTEPLIIIRVNPFFPRNPCSKFLLLAFFPAQNSFQLSAISSQHVF
jgi:hypothetical protein